MLKITSIIPFTLGAAALLGACMHTPPADQTPDMPEPSFTATLIDADALKAYKTQRLLSITPDGNVLVAASHDPRSPKTISYEAKPSGAVTELGYIGVPPGPWFLATGKLDDGRFLALDWQDPLVTPIGSTPFTLGEGFESDLPQCGGALSITENTGADAYSSSGDYVAVGTYETDETLSYALCHDGTVTPLETGGDGVVTGPFITRDGRVVSSHIRPGTDDTLIFTSSGPALGVGKLIDVSDRGHILLQRPGAETLEVYLSGRETPIAITHSAPLEGLAISDIGHVLAVSRSDGLLIWSERTGLAPLTTLTDFAGTGLGAASFQTPFKTYVDSGPRSMNDRGDIAITLTLDEDTSRVLLLTQRAN